VAACRALARHSDELLHPGLECLVIVRGAPDAKVDGVIGSHRIHFVSSTCSPAWHGLHALLTGAG
jgi:hypothetical protein